MPYTGLVLVDEVVANLQTQKNKILDARSEDHFHGQNETLDSVGGQIPRAMNRFFKNNLNAISLKPQNNYSKSFQNVSAQQKRLK